MSCSVLQSVESVSCLVSCEIQAPSVLQSVAVGRRALQCVAVFCTKKPCVTTEEPLASANERSISAEYTEALYICKITEYLQKSAM